MSEPNSGFLESELRVGRVLEVAPFPEARNPSYKVTVGFGAAGVRMTSAQVTNYSPEELRGSLVVGVLSLPPRRIAGFRSEFLLLGALGEDGIRLLRPDEGTQVGDLIG
jgi:tRNA-binding protein